MLYIQTILVTLKQQHWKGLGYTDALNLKSTVERGIIMEDNNNNSEGEWGLKSGIHVIFYLKIPNQIHWTVFVIFIYLFIY